MTASARPATPELFDPYDADLQADPYPVYRSLRDEHPLYRNDSRGFWALSRHADVAAALRDHETFSSEGSLAVGGVDVAALLPMMIMTDPPQHDRLRSLVSRAFTGARVTSMAPAVEAIADDLVDRLAGEGGDLIGDLAGPLPTAVIAALMGAPLDETPELRAWIEQFVEGDPGSPERSRRALDGAASLYRRLEELVRERSRSPGADLVSALASATIDGERLKREELVGFCFLLVVAGTETTTNLVANGAVLLHEHPEARMTLAADRSLVPQAIEEMLRHDTPVQGLARVTRRDVERHGRTIRAGEEVLLVFGAANRDERVFTAPDVFDITRRSDKHLAFGQGIHYCLGASLARLEARIVFDRLLARLPEFELDLGRAERLSSSFIRGFRRLPISPGPHG